MMGFESIYGHKTEHSLPIGLELYSVEATQPVMSNIISEVVTNVRGAEQGSDREKMIGVESSAETEELECKITSKTSESPFYLPLFSDYESRSPSVTAISPSHDPDLADISYENMRIIRNNLPYDNRGRSTVMFPLHVQFVNFDISQLTQGTPFTFLEKKQRRRILKITKSIKKNSVVLAFSIGNISQTEPSNVPDTLEISLISRRVNPKTFDNWRLNRNNYDESEDEWCEKYFVTISEFFGIINFIVGNSLSVYPTNESCPPNSNIRSSERKRIRSNVRKFLRDKTLTKVLPNNIAENILLSQRDFILGTYNQIMSYNYRKPRTFYKSFSVLKFEELQDAVLKCVSFFSFEVLLD